MDPGYEACLNHRMGMYGAALGVMSALTLVACAFTPGQLADDGDGGVDSDALDPDAAPGLPDAAEACVAGCNAAGALVTCDGDQAVVTPCELGCLPTSAPHCASLDPSNLAGLADLVGVTGTVAFVAAERHYVDTDTGELYYIDNSGNADVRVVLRPGTIGVDAGISFRRVDDGTAVLGVASLALPADATLVGHGSRALIILAASTVEIDGTIDFMPGICTASGTMFGTSRRCGGPGAGSGGSSGSAGTGCAGGGGGSNGGDENGGAGGGMATAGGPGGGTATKPAAMPTAITTCAPATLEPLRGGSGGGAGAPNGGSYGGGGGGGLQLTSLVSIQLGDNAEIYAGGAGAKGTTVTNRGGGGGGAGGAVLLEAPMVSLGGASLIASGGGGGGGRVASPAGALNERDGTWGNGIGPAAGGLGDPGGAGNGGPGAFAASAAGAGGGNVDGTGGGGGGLGRIRINSRSGQVSTSMAVLAGAVSQGPLTTR